MLLRKPRIFWIKFGLISGYIAAAVFLIGTTIAVFLYPNYDFLRQMISELGIRQDVWIQTSSEWLVEAAHPEALNVTLIITGMLFYPFFPSLYFFFNPRKLWRKILTILISIGGIVGGTFLSLVGVFDAGMFLYPHVVVAMGCYFAITVVYLLWGIMVITLDQESPYKKSKLWVVDPILCLLGLFIGIVNTGLFDLINYVGGWKTLAFYQKSLAYLFVILFLFVGIRITHMVRKKPELFVG